MAIIPINGVGTEGIVTDVTDALLPPGAWSSGRNIRFDNSSVSKMEGHEPLFTATGDFQLVRFWPRPEAPAYIYATQANVFRVNSDGSTATIGSGFTTGSSAKWQSALFNGGYTVIVNNRANIPRYITYGTDGSVDETALQLLPDWPSSLRAHVIRPAGFALMAANLTSTDGSNVVTTFPGTVRISSQAAPGGIPASWSIGTQLLTTADEFELASGSPIVELVSTRGYTYAFTTNSIHRITLPSSRQPTQVQDLVTGYGALATDCAVEFDGKLFAVDRSSIYVTNGSGNIEHVAEAKTQDYFLANLNQTHYENTHVVQNLSRNEMWINFPNLTSTGRCNEALIWNYEYNTWSIRDLPNVLSTTEGPRRANNVFQEGGEHLVSAANGSLFSMDTGYTFNGQAYESFVERTSLVLGDIKDSQWTGHVYPIMKGSGSVQYQVEASNTIGNPPNLAAATKIDFNTVTGYKVDPRANGRFFNIRVSETSTFPWTLSGYSIDENVSEMR